jgi:hypothetical protein
MTKRISLLIAALAVAPSCVSSEADRPSQASAAASLQAETISEVRVFYQDRNVGEGHGYDEALHSGLASVVDGCLFLGNAIVVWHPDRSEDATRAVEAALQADGHVWSVEGGGMSLAEDGPLPTEITQHCPTEEVWFASPRVMRAAP